MAQELNFFRFRSELSPEQQRSLADQLLTIKSAMADLTRYQLFYCREHAFWLEWVEWSNLEGKRASCVSGAHARAVFERLNGQFSLEAVGDCGSAGAGQPQVPLRPFGRQG